MYITLYMKYLPLDFMQPIINQSVTSSCILIALVHLNYSVGRVVALFLLLSYSILLSD